MKPNIDLERLKACISAVAENPQYCSNGTCIWPKPTGGMHTNGGCHCLANIKDVKLRRAINAVSESFKALPELITALEEAKLIIAMLDRIVSKSDGVAGYHLNDTVAEWDEFDMNTGEWLAQFKKEEEK